eukprot:4452067-Amphidinium_carterae.1
MTILQQQVQGLQEHLLPLKAVWGTNCAPISIMPPATSWLPAHAKGHAPMGKKPQRPPKSVREKLRREQQDNDTVQSDA